MKTIKKAILLVVFILTGAVSHMLAQPMDPGLNAPRIQNLITEFSDELNLSENQKNELIALQIKQRDQFGADRPDFRKDRDRRRGKRGRNFKHADREIVKAHTEARMEKRQEVLDILTDEQVKILQTEMIEKADKAHEFRTFRHRYIVKQAAIQSDKVEQVLNLLDQQSESRLELHKQWILNPEELNRNMVADRIRQMRDTDDQLRSILTVNEYESLHKNLGFADRPHRKPEQRARRWSR